MLVVPALKSSAKSAEAWICAACLQRRQRLPSRRFSHASTRTAARRSQYAVSQGPQQRNVSSDSSTTSRRNYKLPGTPARTRFAPSPTGYMHIGGLRTALFSYLLAKRTEGQFLLRIEDTDQKRLVPGAEERLCQDLRWAGLQWDEGPQVGGPHGPYKQSERTHIYQEHAKQLLDSGSAYRCFCTPQTTASNGTKAAYVTSGCYQDCSSLPAEQAEDLALDQAKPYTIRLKPPPNAHKRVYSDLVYGRIQRLKRSPSGNPVSDDGDAGIDAADTILVKSDGTPTYHFANVVDDHLMRITHVIRGSEWMASTPLHYDLYSAFEWTPPTFAHVGLLLDETKAKLSKRSDSGLVLDVKGMREQQGILPEVLCNFLALLGWSNPGRNDVMEMRELVRDFDLKFTKGNSVVKNEKLWFLQKQHVARRCEVARETRSSEPLTGLIDAIGSKVRQAFPGPVHTRGQSLEAYIGEVFLADSKSYSTPQHYVDRNRYFFHFDASEVPAEAETYDKDVHITAGALSEFMADLLAHFDFAQPYRDSRFAVPKPEREDEAVLTPIDLVKQYKSWNKALMRYLREKLSYGLPGPGVGAIMAILGYEECRRRLGVKMDAGKGGW
ncbi:uncharacterized protein MYCGRDRAFT_68164 [Zymoseptoria tritici IPO323]|uniref:glutamate--tRNA ligase n=1 Tax=Zymoseptoria tritici (strain CBS 115943 / IPO323) TaxID=336722 RepID=F9X4A4_ZYMTI|nr:uncharacterized protein MYCGRDRAFT_68164 [Zymoseptoria tritici IPO323]EGP89862.1 hypothetical protein MYCGRDRAFT_68164 [Zymoseptoria tritici IPO323]